MRDKCTLVSRELECCNHSFIFISKPNCIHRSHDCIRPYMENVICWGGVVLRRSRAYDTTRAAGKRQLVDWCHCGRRTIWVVNCRKLLKRMSLQRNTNSNAQASGMMGSICIEFRAYVTFPFTRRRHRLAR